MKNILCFLIFFSVFSSVYALQNSEIKQIDQEINKAKKLRNENAEQAKTLFQKSLNSSRKINYIKGIVDACYYIAILSEKEGNLDKAISYYTQAARLVNKYPDPDMEVAVLIDMGWVYNIRGEYKQAEEVIKKGLSIAESLKDSILIADCYSYLGAVYDERGLFVEALKLYYRAMDIYSNNKKEDDALRTLHNIAVVYKKQGEYKKAMAVFRDELIEAKKQHDEETMAAALVSIGIIYNEQNKPDSAIRYHQTALEYFQKSGDIYGQTSCLHNLGEAFEKQKHYTKAIANFRESLRISTTLNSKKTEEVNLLRIARNFYYLNELDSAKLYAIKASNIAKNIEAHDDLKEGYLIMSDIHRKQGDFKKSLEFFTNYSSLKDKLKSEEQLKQYSELQARYETTEKEKELAVMKKENEVQAAKQQSDKLIKTTLSLGLIMMLVLSVFLFMNYRSIGKKNAILAKQKEEINNKNLEINNQKEQLIKKNNDLQELNNEKDQLISIVSHDLRSPLNHIKGLLTLVKMEGMALSDNQIDYMNKALQSADDLSKLINKILDFKAIESQKLNVKSEPLDVAEVVHNVVDFFATEAEKKEIVLHKNIADEEYYSFLDRNYFIQILENLLSNAIKFSGWRKNINITLLKKSQNIRIEISDEGPGFSDSDKKKLFHQFQKLSARPTGGEKSTGLGLAIVKRYVQAMNGSVYCESSPGNGATFIVEFPEAKVRDKRLTV